MRTIYLGRICGNIIFSIFSLTWQCCLMLADQMHRFFFVNIVHCFGFYIFRMGFVSSEWRKEEIWL